MNKARAFLHLPGNIEDHFHLTTMFCRGLQEVLTGIVHLATPRQMDWLLAEVPILLAAFPVAVGSGGHTSDAALAFRAARR